MTSQYHITIPRSAEKEIQQLSGHIADRIVIAIDKLAVNPRPSGCKKLKYGKDLWRIRIGDWRVIYAIDDTIRLISVSRVAHRREVYD